jgi:hypothetical protein
MTAFDRVVSSDFAALAADNRRRLPPVDDVLAGLAAPSGQRDAPLTGDVVLVRLSGMYADRVARATAGAIGLICAVGLWAFLFGPGSRPIASYLPLGWMLQRDSASVGLWLAALMLAGYAGGRAFARRRFVRAVASEDQARRMVQAIDGRAVGFAIGGITASATLFGAVAWAIGAQRWDAFWDSGRSGPLRDDLGIVIAAVAFAAAHLGRACQRGSCWVQLFERAAIVPAGLALGAIAVSGAWALDTGSLPGATDQASWSAIHTALTVGGAMGTLLITAGATLRRRRRELARMADDAARRTDAQVASAWPALGPLGRAFARRVAQIFGGAAATLCVLAVLVVLQLPVGRASIRPQIIDLIDRAVPWQVVVLRDRATIALLLAVVAIGAGLVGARRADRSFERDVRSRGGDALPHARRRLARVDGWSTALAIAGLASIGILFGVVSPALGDAFWMFFQHHGARVDAVVALVLHELSVALPVAIEAALVIGALCARESARGTSRWLRALEHRVAITAGVALGLITSAAGFLLDFGVFDVSFPVSRTPPMLVHIGLAVSCIISVLLVASGVVLRRRRAERMRLGAF